MSSTSATSSFSLPNCILLPKPQPTQEIMLPMRTARFSLLSRNLSHSSRPSLSLVGGALRASSSRASVPSSFSSPSSPFPTPSLLRNPISLRAYATAATPGSGGSKLNGLKMAMGGGQGAGEALKEFVSSRSRLSFLVACTLADSPLLSISSLRVST